MARVKLGYNHNSYFLYQNLNYHCILSQVRYFIFNQRSY